MTKPFPIFVTRRQALAIVTGSLITALGPKQSAAAELAGSVAELTGIATAAAEGKTRSLSLKEAVLVGDLVKTEAEARLALLLGARTTLRLGGQTELRLDRYLMDAGGEIDFLQGAILFDRPGGQPSANLRFKTPYGMIAVRGTSFLAGPSRRAFSVFVSRGKVEVTGGGRTIVLGSKQGTDIARPGAAPSRPRVWSAKRIRELEKQVR